MYSTTKTDDDRVCIHLTFTPYGPAAAPDGYIVIIQDITERKRAEDEIKRQLQEKEVLLKEVHHRIKNNIASIEALLSLQNQSAINPETVSILNDAMGRVQSMRIIYDKLLLSGDYRETSIKNYLSDLIESVIAIFPEKDKVSVIQRIDDFPLDVKALFPLGTIVNELITNAMKYAFVDKEAGTIVIELLKSGDEVTLMVQDDGHGLPENFDVTTSGGFGLMLVTMLAEQIKGIVSIARRNGTRCTITFKA